MYLVFIIVFSLKNKVIMEVDRFGESDCPIIYFLMTTDLKEHILDDQTLQKVSYKRYAEMWIEMFADYMKDPNSKYQLFFNSPAVIIVTGNSEIYFGLASSNMALMVNALGLGTFFSGFFLKAAQSNEIIKDFV